MAVTQGLTQELGHFLADVVANGVPAAVREAAKDGMIDCIGCMVAGSGDEAVTLALRVFPSVAPSPLPSISAPSRLWLSGRRASVTDAAMLNGIAAHVLDYDDSCLRGHPSAVLMPAILAIADARQASGAAMIDAYVAGYEVWAELVDREAGFHQMKGWHPTGIFGAIGAAAAAAVLYRLDAGQAAHALGLAASQSAGLMSNFGAMSKSFHVGRAAQAGVVAAQLAAVGFTASPDALEHPRGFLMAVSPQGAVDTDRAADGLGKTWQLAARRVNLKKYPTCYYTHRALDAVLALVREQPVAPDAVERVEVTLSKEHALALRNAQPQTALAAKFSMQFAMACALVSGKVGLLELTDACVQRADIQALMRRVAIVPDDRYDAETPGAAHEDRVTLFGKDGSVRTKAVHRASGHAQHPLDAGAVRAKFLDCLAYGGYAGDAAALYERLARLEDQPAP